MYFLFWNASNNNFEIWETFLDKDAKEFGKLVQDWKVEALPSFRFYKNGESTGKEITGYKKKLLRESVSNLI